MRVLHNLFDDVRKTVPTKNKEYYRQPFGWGGGLSRSNSPGLRVFCDASHLYHKKHSVRNSLCELRHPQPMDISLHRIEHGYLPNAMAAWYVNEPRTQNFRGISECTTKIQAQDCERIYLAAIARTNLHSVFVKQLKRRLGEAPFPEFKNMYLNPSCDLVHLC